MNIFSIIFYQDQELVIEIGQLQINSVNKLDNEWGFFEIKWDNQWWIFCHHYYGEPTWEIVQPIDLMSGREKPVTVWSSTKWFSPIWKFYDRLLKKFVLTLK